MYRSKLILVIKKYLYEGKHADIYRTNVQKFTFRVINIANGNCPFADYISISSFQADIVASI